MERLNSYKARLDKLECHFKWQPDIRGNKQSIEWYITKCQKGIEESPFMTLHDLAILSYIYTVESPKMSIKEAIGCIEKAKNWQEINPQEKFIPCDFVLRVNELHIEYLTCTQDEDKLSQLETEWSDRRSNPKWEAAVWGTMGYTMSRNVQSNDKQGIEAFKKAYKLDKNNPYWYFGHARLIDWNTKGMHYNPSDEKMKLLKKAYDLGKDLGSCQNALHAACYAEARVIQAIHVNKDQMKPSEKAMFLKDIKFARENADQNQSVYRHCAKSYRLLREYEMCRNCLMEGIVKCTEINELNCALGMHFRMNEKDKNPTDARIQFKKSKGYFWAEMELLKMKIDGELKDNTTDTLVEFARLAAMSSKDPTYRAALHKERGLYLLKCGGKDDIAVDEFLRAAMSETKNQYGQALRARKEIKIAMEERMENGGLKQKTDLALFLQKCQPQIDDYLEESAKLYKEILETNDMNSEDTSFIVFNYGDVLIRLERYEEAIKVLDKKGVSKEIRCLAAQALIGAAAKKGVSNLVKGQHLRRCLALHCKNGAEGLLNHLKSMVKKGEADAEAEGQDALSFQQSKSLYNDCALITKIAKDPHAFSLETEPPVSQEAVIEGNIREILGLNVPGFRELRNSRYEMSLDPDDSPLRIVPVLCEARNQLDRVHKRLLKKLNPQANLRGNFPLSPDLQSEGEITLDKVKDKLHAYFIKTYKIRTVKIWEGFAEEHPKQSEELLDFLAKKQVDGQKWFKEWFELTNDHKHTDEITWQNLDEWTQLFHFSHGSNHAEAAHMVAEFAEEHVAKYDSILRECFPV